jgi:hypothetical protein
VNTFFTCGCIFFGERAIVTAPEKLGQIDVLVNYPGFGRRRSKSAVLKKLRVFFH